MPPRVYLYDTTLRDGAQTNGVDFTLHDKRLIASLLDDPVRRRAMGTAAHTHITDNHDLPEAARRLDAILTAVTR